MKTKRRPNAPNQLVTRYGSARFYQVKRAQSEWKDPRFPEYKPNWMVRFHVGGETWEESAGPMYPVADGLAAVKVWAETIMRTRLEAMRAGKLEELEAVVRSADAVMLSRLRLVYLQNVPPGKPDYRKNIGRLCSILTEATGMDEEMIPVTDALWSRELLLAWVRMRQEHFRRGWTAHGKAPQDAWQKLRAELKSGKLASDVKWPAVTDAEQLKWLQRGEFPGIDKEAVMECNTTIQTYLRCAKAVFANQREYLVGLKLPDLREFLAFGVDLAAPKGHRAIDDGVMARIIEDLPRLQLEQPQVWAFGLVCAWVGGRPGKVARLTGNALAVLPDGTGVITQPGAKGGNESRVLVDAECAQAVEAVRTAESLFGARSPTHMARIYRAANDWLTSLGMVGTKKMSAFRHRKLNLVRNEFDDEMAALAAGHKTTAMVRSTYTRNEKVVPLVNPFQKAG